MRRAYRHGDVIIKCGGKVPTKAKRCDHLILAHGEVTGHKHQITEGEAELYEHEGKLFLRVVSDSAALTHEEHARIDLPCGEYEVQIQREYEPSGWRAVAD
jgi:hypothetical protein